AIPAVLAGLGHSLMFHTMTSLTIQSFPQEYRGTGSALALMTLDLGTLLGAPVLGWIGAEFGYSMLFNTIAFALIATFVFCLKKI
ncbi:MAG: MFS transporter, partial [Planctomycetota bacterium]